MIQPTQSDASAAYPQTSNSGFWFFLLLLLVAGGLLIWFVVRPLAMTAGTVDEPLATLHLQPLTPGSSEVSLAELDGQIALVNFWGTWCPPCRREFPDIAALEEKYRADDRVRVLAVSCSMGREDDLAALRDETQQFLDQRRSSLPNYADRDHVTRMAVRDAVGFEGYPTTIVLDGKGRIRHHWTGVASRSEMDAAIESLLAEQ